jgi:hypothetical protein
VTWSRTLENADSGREVVHTASGLEGSGEDLNGRNEIVSEAVVQVALLRKDMLVMFRIVHRSCMLSDGCG